MSWILIVISGHLINAGAFVLTKFLLDKHIKNATVFAILIGILGLAVFLLAPFGLQVPTLLELTVDIAAGALLILALILFNYVLKNFEVTRVVPITGGAVPFFTFVLAFFFLSERLSVNELIAFVMLLIGTVILANQGKAKGKFSFKLILYSLGAGLLFAASFVLTKYAFDLQPFISGFIWIRLGTFLVALFLIFNPKYWRLTVKYIKATSIKIKFVFLISLALGALGFTLINYAISLGSVTLVNALQGIQYALLLIIVIIATVFFPKFIKEKITGLILVKKIIGIILISAGIVFLAI